MACRMVEGIERTSMCGLRLTRDQADSLEHYFGMQQLDVPSRLGRVTNILSLLFECQLLLFDNPRPMVLSGVFDSPRQLFEPRSAVQYSSVVMAWTYIGEACLTFVLDYG